MRDFSRAIGLGVLGCLAIGCLWIMGNLALNGEQIPASIGAAFGTAVGALAGVLSPRD